VGDPDLSGAGGRGGPGRPGFERPRGLVVLPAVGAGAPASEDARAAARQAAFLRRWGALIATLLVGAVVIVLIAVLWSNAPAAPNPRSLPPAAVVGP
jgi:hypothetical protein